MAETMYEIPPEVVEYQTVCGTDGKSKRKKEKEKECTDKETLKVWF